ncbi:MAG TPA: two-component sensor histidine kinase, partial [Mycolicibacillus parakoreensis]|nr:two-component sensor histidine kinase [Mycolicibacillus parakoreensis]
MSPARGRRRWRRWPRTVRTQLVVGVCAVVSVVVLALGGFSVLSLRSYVTTMNDAEVSRSLAAFSHAFAQRRERAGDEPLTHFVGQGPGNLIAVLDDATVINSAVFANGEARPADDELTAALAAQRWTDGVARTVSLGAAGNYRVQSRTVDGHRLVAGISLTRSTQLLTAKMLVVAALVVVALLVTALGTILVIGYALRPLRRVAAT